VAGFFGRNFGFTVENVEGWGAFVGLGIGLQVLTLAILLVFFKRRGWF
jgi:hypothetical protein